jgi:SulP family sulfate permease
VGAPLLGFIMNFVPHPVICGFTSAGGLIIAMSQVKSIVGFKIRKENLQWGCAASVFVLFCTSKVE